MGFNTIIISRYKVEHNILLIIYFIQKVYCKFVLYKQNYYTRYKLEHTLIKNQQYNVKKYAQNNM